MLRRDVLKALTALAAAPSAAWAAEPGLKLGEATAFDASTVAARAKILAANPYVARPKVPKAWRNLSYDQYRQIWFDSRNALWQDTDLPQRLDVFPPGLYFPQPVALHVVEEDMASSIRFDMGVFDTTDAFPDMPVDDTLGYSGLRLRADLARPAEVGRAVSRVLGTPRFKRAARRLRGQCAEYNAPERFRSFVDQLCAPNRSSWSAMLPAAVGRRA